MPGTCPTGDDVLVLSCFASSYEAVNQLHRMHHLLCWLMPTTVIITALMSYPAMPQQRVAV